MLGVDCGTVTLVTSSAQGEKRSVVRLNNNDAFFQELRDDNIARVIRSLNEKAKQVKGGC